MNVSSKKVASSFLLNPFSFIPLIILSSSSVLQFDLFGILDLPVLLLFVDAVASDQLRDFLAANKPEFVFKLLPNGHFWAFGASGVLSEPESPSMPTRHGDSTRDSFKKLVK